MSFEEGDHIEELLEVLDQVNTSLLQVQQDNRILMHLLATLTGYTPQSATIARNNPVTIPQVRIIEDEENTSADTPDPTDAEPPAFL